MAVLDPFWFGAVGFLPRIPAGVVFVKPGLAVVVVFLETLAVGGVVFLSAVEGGLGGSGFVLFGLMGLEGFGVFVVAVAVAVVVTLAAAVAVVVVGLCVVVSSASGLTTTKEVTGVTKLYLSERLVALSASNLCIEGSVVFSLARSSSLMVE